MESWWWSSFDSTQNQWASNNSEMELLKAMFCVLLVFFTIQVDAQPGNDECLTPYVLTTNDLDNNQMCVTISENNTDATPWEFNPGVFYSANCWGGSIDSVVFFQFTAQGVSAEITVSNGPATPHIALVTFPAGQECNPSVGTEIACAIGNTITIDNGLTPNTNYYIILGFDAQAEGPYDICVYNPTNQPNDECDMAVPITNLDAEACEFNLDNYYPSTSSNFFPGCWGGTLAEVWFSLLVKMFSLPVI